MISQKDPSGINSGAQFLAAIAHNLLNAEQEQLPENTDYTQGGFTFSAPQGGSQPISTMTGEPVPTTEEVAEKKENMLQMLPGIGQELAWLAPGAGNYLAFQESMQKGKEASNALSEGDYSGAALNYLEQMPINIGILPGIGVIERDSGMALNELEELSNDLFHLIKERVEYMNKGKIAAKDIKKVVDYARGENTGYGE